MSDNILDTAAVVEVPSKNNFKFLTNFLNKIFPSFTSQNIAVLRLEGIIGHVSSLKSGMKFDVINKLIEDSFKIKNLQALLLVINSPGGSPVQSDLIASRIINLSKEHNIPVYSFVEDVAASGGYWLACAGEKIFVNKSSILGSIGVISASFGFDKAIKKLGIDRRIVSQGEHKSVLDPFLPLKEFDLKLIQDIQQDIHQNFIKYVISRRGNKLHQTENNLFQGDFWSGEKAVALGIADEIDNLYSFIKKHYPKAKVKYIQNKSSWIKRKLGLADLGLKNIGQHIVEEIDDTACNNKFKFF